MGNNPTQSVVSGSDFFKDNENFTDEEDDELVSLHHAIRQSRAHDTKTPASRRSFSVQNTTRSNAYPVDTQYFNRISSRASNFDDLSIAPANAVVSSSSLRTSHNPRSASVLSRSDHVQPVNSNYNNNNNNYYMSGSRQRSLSRKSINQNRINEVFYENLREATPSISSSTFVNNSVQLVKPIVERLPPNALSWLQNEGITTSSSTMLPPLKKAPLSISAKSHINVAPPVNKASVIVESLPLQALSWLQNAGISTSASFITPSKKPTYTAPINPIDTNMSKNEVFIRRPLQPPPPPKKVLQQNFVVIWDTPNVVLNRRFKNLGITTADPAQYMARFGDSLVNSSSLPELIKSVRPSNGAKLAGESQHNANIKLVGDVQALSLIKSAERNSLFNRAKHFKN